MKLSQSVKIGVISDTHGLLRPEAIAALEGCDHILHAGDVGDAAILDTLAKIAPVTAVRGNVDLRGPCSLLPPVEVVELAGRTIYMLHNLNHLDLDPAAAGFSAVIYGHSHMPTLEQLKGVFFFNPGSCGPRRFSLPISLGFLSISEGKLEPLLLTLL